MDCLIISYFLISVYPDQKSKIDFFVTLSRGGGGGVRKITSKIRYRYAVSICDWPLTLFCFKKSILQFSDYCPTPLNFEPISFWDPFILVHLNAIRPLLLWSTLPKNVFSCFEEIFQTKRIVRLHWSYCTFIFFQKKVFAPLSIIPAQVPHKFWPVPYAIKSSTLRGRRLLLTILQPCMVLHRFLQKLSDDTTGRSVQNTSSTCLYCLLYHLLRVLQKLPR